MTYIEATVDCLAHEAAGEARSKLWRCALGYYPGYASCQARTEGRQIPVMILSPTTTKP